MMLFCCSAILSLSILIFSFRLDITFLLATSAYYLATARASHLLDASSLEAASSVF